MPQRGPGSRQDGGRGRREGAEGASERARRSEPSVPALRWILLIPVLAGLLAYLPGLSGEFIWDDTSFISGNPAAHDLGALPRAVTEGYGWVPGQTDRTDSALYYRPVVTAANSLNWAFSGGGSSLFRLANAILHGMAAGTLAGLGILLGLSPAAALGAGVLFALHPALSEAVAWISGRTDLLAGLFGLLFLVSFLGWRQRRSCHLFSGPVPWAAGLFLYLALASKESAWGLVLWPALLLLFRTGTQPRRLGPGSWICLLLPVVLYGAVRVQALGSLLPEQPLLPDRGGLGDRLVLAGALITSYARILAAPWPLAMEPPSWVLSPGSRLLPGLAGWLLAAALLFAGVRSFLGSRVRLGAAGTGARPAPPAGSRAAWVGIALAVTGITPVLQFIPTGEIYGERFLYLPAAGLLLAGAAWLDRAWMHGRLFRTGLVVLAAGIPFLILLQLRLPAWKSEEALFASAVRARPENVRALANLGSVYIRQGRLREAEPLLSRAVERDPEDPWKLAQYGALLVNLDRAGEGAPYLEKALERGPRDRALIKNLGIARTREGRFSEAAGLLAEADSMGPPDASIVEALAMAERKLGRYAPADSLYLRSMELDPSRRTLWLNRIGMLYSEAGRPQDAREAAMQFLQRFPQAPEAGSVRGLLRQMEDRPEE